MGMLKEGVRLDRVRGGRQKYRRNGESPYLVNGLNCNNSSNSNSAYYNVLNNMRTGQQNPLISAMLNCEPEPNSVGNGESILVLFNFFLTSHYLYFSAFLLSQNRKRTFEW